MYFKNWIILLIFYFFLVFVRDNYFSGQMNEEKDLRVIKIKVKGKNQVIIRKNSNIVEILIDLEILFFNLENKGKIVFWILVDVGILDFLKSIL